MSYITGLEIKLSQQRNIIDVQNVQLEGYEALQLDYKRLKRKLEKQRKSNRGKQGVIEQYRLKYGWLK